MRRSYGCSRVRPPGTIRKKTEKNTHPGTWKRHPLFKEDASFLQLSCNIRTGTGRIFSAGARTGIT